MIEPNFNAVRKHLLCGGVAPKHVRRAMFEFHSHYDDLFLLAIHRGSGPDDAAREACERLGDTDTLVASFIARPELRSLTRRHPGVIYTLGPTLLLPLCFMLVTAVSMALGSYFLHATPSDATATQYQIKQALQSGICCSPPEIQLPR